MARDNMRVLIVNEPGRNVTAAIRSLARSGYDLEVSIAYPKRPNSIDRRFTSKYVKRKFFIRNPVDSYEGFKRDVKRLVKEEGFSFLLPFGFRTTVALAKCKAELEKAGAILPIASLDTVLKAHDKEACFRILKKKRLAMPKTYFHRSLDGLLRQRLSFPLIVKARRNSGISQGLEVVYDKEGLERAYERIDSYGKKSFILDFSRPLVQEYVDGDVYDANFFMAGGEVKAFVFQRRLRSLNENIGGGVINETLNNRLKKEAYEYGKRVLNAISWEGPCQVELIRDRKDKRFKLIEVNPKLWGTLELSIRAGVNFPLEMIRHYCFGESVRPKPYRSMRFYWFFDLAFSKLKYRARIPFWLLVKAFFSRRNELDLRDWRADFRNVMVGLKRGKKR